MTKSRTLSNPVKSPFEKTSWLRCSSSTDGKSAFLLAPCIWPFQTVSAGVLLLAVLLSLAFAPRAVAENRVLKAADLKELIESKNALVLGREQEVKAAEERQGSFGRSFLPSLELRGSQETFKKGQAESKTQPSYGAEMSVNLLNGGRDRLEGEVREKAAERKVLEKRETAAEELKTARETYFEMLFLRDRARLLKEMQKLNSENTRAAERRIRSGVALQTDRVEFEMKDVELKQDLERVERRLDTLEKDLVIRLGWESGTQLELSESLDHEHDWEKFLKFEDKDSEHLYRPLEVAAEELSLSAKSENRGWWPKVDAYAGWNQYNEREEDGPEAVDRRESVVGVRVKMNLFDVLTSHREAGARRAEAEAARLQAGYRREQVRAHRETDRLELRLLHDQIHEAEENIRRADRYFSLTQSEYTRGVKNSPDVLGATDKVFEAKLRRLEIVRDFQVTRAALLAKVGQ